MTLHPVERAAPVDPAPTGVRAGLRAGLRSLPASVRAITLVWTALLLGASLVWPMTMGYDEASQFGMAQTYMRTPFTFHDPATLGSSDGTRQINSSYPGYPPPPRKTLGDSYVADRGERPTWNDLGGSHVSSVYPPNQMVQHPPLYFWMGAVILKVPGVQSLAWDQQLWLLRLLSVVLSIPVPALAYSAARRLWAWGGRRDVADGADGADGVEGVDAPLRADRLRTAHRVGLLAALVPLTFPNLPRDESSVNNDSLLLLAGSVLCWLLARVVTGDLRRRTGVGVGLALAVALMTKGFALVMPPVVLLAYVLGWRARPRTPGRGLRAALAPLAIAAGLSLAGSWWWVRNLVLFHVVQTDGAGPRFSLTTYGQPDDKGSLWTFVPTFTERFVQLSWGGIGLPQSPDVTPVVVYGWTAVVWVGILCALLVRRGAGERRRLVVLLAALPLTFVVCAVGSWAVNKRWSTVITGTSGRYLFHLVVLTAAAAAIGWAAVLGARALRRCAPWVLGVALLTQALAWVAIIVTWYPPGRTFGLDSLARGTGQLLRWSPVAPWVTLLLVVVLPAASALVALAALVHEARDARGRPDDAADPVPVRPPGSAEERLA